MVAYLLNQTHQKKFNWLINAPWAYNITISMNVPDMVANNIKRCVWILRYVCKCIVAYILIDTHQSKFNWLNNAQWAYNITISINVQDLVQMIKDDACGYYEHVCKCIVAYLLNHTHQSKFNWLINAPWAYKITISINVSDMVANDKNDLNPHPPEACGWTCLQMHSCIPLKSHPPEQI